MFNGKSILVTGGTGTFGKAFISHVLENCEPRRLICFSRDEFKQWELRRLFPQACMRWFVGDVRDIERLRMAFRPVDTVIHAAALKHVPTGEVNPIEVIKTNVIGAQNVITAAIETGVERVLALSTDKACSPINLYGASKLASDKLFVAANGLSGESGTRFAVVRYGNVVGSRGSVVPLFLEQAKTGVLTVTHAEMTRFFITIEQGVGFVCQALADMRGGELFVPKIPSARIIDVAKAVHPGAEVRIVGIRGGEKLHEALISAADARTTIEQDSRYVIEPEHEWYRPHIGHRLGGDFEYRSDNNPERLGPQALQALVESVRQAIEGVPAPVAPAGRGGCYATAAIGG